MKLVSLQSARLSRLIDLWLARADWGLGNELILLHGSQQFGGIR